MNDLETRLKALRPLSAPRAILDRARRGRRPWLLALGAAVAALALVAFVAAYAPMLDRPGPASDYRTMVDRLVKAETLDIETHGKGRLRLPSGQEQKVERTTVLKLKGANRLYAVIEETRPDGPGLDVRIELVSDGKRLVRRTWMKDRLVDRSEQAAPGDLRLRVVRWLMSTGDLHPLQTVFQTDERDPLPADLPAVPAPEGYPRGAMAWRSTDKGFEVTLVFDPAKVALLGRSVTLPGGGSSERFLEFYVDDPLEDALFVLPE